ncbi:hypothetical protein B0H11DRAFT_2292473 [Mycena galericulata]|nr:hypothetical protein B0H11DRAFT_2292473 [Mycena galericulata]
MPPKPAAKAKAPPAKPKPAASKPAPESQLQKLIAKQKQTEKALAEANAKLLVAKRNSEMLEEEDNAPTRPKKKSKNRSSSPPASDPFGEKDAVELASLMGSDRVVPELEDDASIHDSEDGQAEPSEDEDNDTGDQLESSSMAPDSDMIVDDPAVKTPKKAGHRRKASEGAAPRVTKATFSPMSVRLANVGRFAVRLGIATEEGFPADHAEFTWNAITAAVANTEVPELVGRLEKAQESDERRAQLTTYAWSGASQLRGEVKTLCKAAVALYGIPGEFSPTEIVKHVKFLTGKKGIFKFGGINLIEQTYDAQQPYGASCYKVIISKQWFDTLKSEGVRASSFERFVDAPVPILTLVTDGMENSLKEWATGVRIQIKFTEEEFGPRYQHHRAALLNLQMKSPTWFAQFQRSLYSKIVLTSNFPHLKRIVADPEEDELDGVDFEALEAAATGGDKSEAPAPAASPALDASAAATAETDA